MLQQRTNKALTTDPFRNTYEVDEVSPEVESRVVARLKCLQHWLGHRPLILTLNKALSIVISLIYNH
jgi:hypothetical protein